MSSFFSKTAKIVPAITMLAALEILVQKPESLWRIFSILIGVVFVASLYLSGFLKQRKLNQLGYLILPLLYTAGCVSLFVLAQKSLAQHFFLAGTSIILAIALNNIHTLSKQYIEKKTEVILKSTEDRKKTHSLAANQILIILTTFFIFSTLFGIIYLLSFAIWQSLMIAVATAFLLSWQFLRERFAPSRSLLYAAISALSLIQIFWALTFWPTNYIANTIVIIASFYIILGILNHYSTNTLTKGRIKVYFSIVLIVVLAVLLTAQWKPQ